MHRPRLLSLCCLVLLAGSACRGARPSTADVTAWTLHLAAAPVDAGASTMGPQLLSSPHGVSLSWMAVGDTATTLRFAERTAARWTPARTVVSGADWFVSGVDVPAVLRLRDRSLVAQWLVAVNLETEAYDIRLATSHDDGASWSPAFSPHHDGTPTQHGFASLFEWPAAQGGGLGLFWLDGRTMTPAERGYPTGDMNLQVGRFNAKGAQTVEAALNTRVCECCPTSMAIATDGPVVAFRDRSPSDVRDIHVVRHDGRDWAPPVAVHADNWTLDACPVNGPAIAARGSHVAVAWFTAPGDDGHAFLAFSDDGGRTFGPPVRLDDRASLGHVGVVLLEDGSAIATWMEFDDGSSWRARRVAAGGAKSTAQVVAGGNGRYVSGIPRIALDVEALVFAWTETRGEEPGAAQQVTVATAPLPGSQ